MRWLVYHNCKSSKKTIGKKFDLLLICFVFTKKYIQKG